MRGAWGLALFVTLLALAWLWQPADGGASREGQASGEEEGTIVARAYFTERQMVHELAAWKEPWEVRYDRGYLVIDLTPAEAERLRAAGFRLVVDEALTAEWNAPRLPLPTRGGGIPGFACYRTVEETFASAQGIVAANPMLATWSDIGDSWERTQSAALGYDLQVLKLTNAAVSGPKPKLFVMSALHAREYTTAELNTRFAEYLVDQYNVDADATWLLDHHEIHLLLQANPDGRKRAEAGSGWRKNTNNAYCTNTGSRGADLNRNFAFDWRCCDGSSPYPCDLTYHGVAPASEPEVQAIEGYVRAQFPDQRDAPIAAAAPVTSTGLFLDLHSYGRQVMWPWGSTSQPAGNAVALQTLGRKFAYFNQYTPQQAISLYPTDGTSGSFAYGELGLAAYTFELGTAFFERCSTFEATVLPDNLPALLYAAKVARTPYLLPSGPDVLALTLDSAASPPGVPVTLSATLDDSRFSGSNGSEAVQAIAAAEYTLDVPPWHPTASPAPLAPADGSFDSPVEGGRATIETTGLAPGRHTLFVRAQDSSGNWGPPSALFLRLLEPTAPTRAYLPLLAR